MTTDYSSAIQQLHSRINNLESGLRSAFNDLTDATNRSAEVITAEIRTNTVEVRRNTEVSARQEIAKQEATLLAVEPIIDEQHASITTELKRFETDLYRIVDKYNMLYERLQKSFHKDIRILGAKIFELVEEVYQREIEARIIAPMLSDAGPGIEAVVNQRDAVLQQSYENLEYAKSEFIGQRTDFLHNLGDWVSETTNTTNSEQELFIPFLVIDLGGAERKLAVVPPTIDGVKLRFSTHVVAAASSQLISRNPGMTKDANLVSALQSAVGRIARVYLADNPVVPTKSREVNDDFNDGLKKALEIEIQSLSIDPLAKEILAKKLLENLPAMIAG